MAVGQEGDVRVRLLESAAQLLSEEGPAALSTRRLAAAAGTSTMAVYTQFGGMPALVREVVTEGFARLTDHLAAVTRTGDALADLARLGAAYRRNALANPHLYAVMFGTAALGGYRLSGDELEIGRSTFEVLVDAVRTAMDTGRFRPDDPERVAAQLWSATHGCVMLELAGYLPDSQQVLGPMMANLVSALRA